MSAGTRDDREKLVLTREQRDALEEMSNQHAARVYGVPLYRVANLRERGEALRD